MKAKLIALILSLMVLPAFFVVYAQTEDKEVEDEVDSCELVQKKIDEKIKYFEAGKPGHSLTYQILYLKTAAVAQKADILGYKTNVLYQDIDELEALIDNFNENYEDFISALTQAGKSACGKEEVYAKDLVTAKEALDDVKTVTKDITYLYQEGIRGNILNLEKIENE